MSQFVKFLDAVNRLADASLGFVWRLDEQSAAPGGDRVFPNDW